MKRVRVFFVAVVLLGGCNAIFGIDEARLRGDGGSPDGPSDAATALDGASGDASLDGDPDATSDAGGDADADAGPLGCVVGSSEPSSDGSTPDMTLTMITNGVPLMMWLAADGVRVQYRLGTGTPNTLTRSDAGPISSPVVTRASNGALAGYGQRDDGGATSAIAHELGQNGLQLSVRQVPLTLMQATPPVVRSVAQAGTRIGLIVSSTEAAAQHEAYFDPPLNRVSFPSPAAVVGHETGTGGDFIVVSLAAGVAVTTLSTSGGGSVTFNEPYPASNIAIATAPAHGVSAAIFGSRVAAAWAAGTTGSTSIWLTTFDAQDVDGTIEHVNVVPAGLPRSHAAAAVADGSLAVAWHEGQDIKMQLFTYDGTPIASAVTVMPMAVAARFGFGGTTGNRYAIANGSEMRRIACTVP